MLKKRLGEGWRRTRRRRRRRRRDLQGKATTQLVNY